MQNVNMPAFYLGVVEELQKEASIKAAGMELHSMPVNENILPNLSNQAKWKYVKTKDGLKLSDGNLVYSFGMPGEYPSEDTQVQRLEDDNILNFENAALRKGTAQIHRASPDNIYMTLADGAHNPTFMLQHEHGKSWRYSPAKKFLQKLKALEKTTAAPPQQEDSSEGSQSGNVLLDPNSLMAGASDTLKQAYELDISNPYIGGGLLDLDDTKNLFKNVAEGTKNFAKHYVDSNANHPASSLASGYIFERLMSKAKDKLIPGREEARRNASSEEKTREGISDFTGAAIPVAGSILYKGLTS